MTETMEKPGWADTDPCLMRYENRTPHDENYQCCFSYFKRPVTNIIPYKTINVKEAYTVISGNYFERQTAMLRMIDDPRIRREFKAKNFDYATFSGIFSQRGDHYLLQHSGLLTLDIDHIYLVEELKNDLVCHTCFDTVLCFVSPSGQGVKWIIRMDLTRYTHLQWFQSVSIYVKKNLHLDIDRSGKDVSRCCFLPHDPLAYVNPRYVG